MQAYYEKQFQAHLASHEGETEKCRCCNFAAFTTEALLDHFRVMLMVLIQIIDFRISHKIVIHSQK